MASADLPQPWERQENEPEKAFAAFKGYLSQAPPRRMVHASVQHSTAELSKLFNDWRWSERCAAHDRYIEAARFEEREALLRQDEKERTVAQITMLKGLEDVINREIAKLVRDSEASTAFGLVKTGDLNKLVANVITMRRLIHGQSTESVDINVDLKKLTVEELRELQRLQAKIAMSDDEVPDTLAEGK